MPKIDKTVLPNSGWGWIVGRRKFQRREISRGRNHMVEMDVLQELAFLLMAVVGNASVRILRSENIHMAQEEALAKIEGTAKLRDLLRYISEIPKSKKRMETIERNQVFGGME